MLNKAKTKCNIEKYTALSPSVALKRCSTTSENISINCLKILIVDDSKVNIVVAENMLNKMGHKVYSSKNGKDAINTIKNDSFDLVFMDIQMPVMDGIEATSAIRNGIAGSNNKNIPIIAMTANTLPNETNKYMCVGMNGSISKPINALSISNLLSKLF